MSFRSYITRRMVSTIVTYFVIATLIFFLFRQIGSPLGMHISMQMSEEQVQRIQESFGLNEPWYMQYYYFIENFVSLKWGTSFYYMEPTEDVVIERLFNSLFITLPAVIGAYVLGSIGGVYLAWKRGQIQERIGLIMALLFRSTPRFWLGLLLLFVSAVKLDLFPMTGMLSAGSSQGSHLGLLIRPDFYHHIILPIASMLLYFMGLPLLLMRTSILEEINKEFVDIIRAKGASERTVMYKHVARNALLPVTTAFAVAIGFSFGGAILVETVFSYPGVGRLMVNSVYRGDYPVAQFAFLTMAAVVLIMNLLADIAYGYLDPRVAYN